MTTEPAPAPAADPREKLIGQILANRYQIEMRLGEGAMGTVYKAKHVKVGRAFAVKVLHSNLLEDLKVAKRFEREAELAGRLRHANVIGVVDVGETPEGLRYMVMDFAEGADLAEMLSQAPMPAPRIINLTRQMLEGLYHAHEQGLIHRDFKPENVIVEKDMHGIEVPRIVDFGIAILREGGGSPNSEGRLTTNGLVLGTPHYMAPEQAVADPIDHRIDLFALGIVIYEMLCGKLPFDGTGAEVARANLLLDPPMISHRVPYLEVDPLLEAFARRMMAKKRDDRPATAKAARDLLDLIEKDRPAAATALGIPIASIRTPQITEDVPPQRHTHEDSSSDQYDAQPDPGQAPVAAVEAVETVVAPPGPRSKQQSIQTSVAPPLGFADEAPRARTRTWLFAGIGLVVAGGLAAVLLGRGGDDQTVASKPDDTTIVMQPTEPDKPSVTPITPENVVEKVPVETVPDTVAPDKPTPATLNKPVPDKVIKRPVKPDTRTAKGVPVEIKPPGTDTKVTEPEVVPAVAPNASSVAAKWQKVGEQIKALGPGQDDLWNRYRRIQIQNAMKDPVKLREAADILDKLTRDLAALKN